MTESGRISLISRPKLSGTLAALVASNVAVCRGPASTSGARKRTHLVWFPFPRAHGSQVFRLAAYWGVGVAADCSVAPLPPSLFIVLSGPRFRAGNMPDVDVKCTVYAKDAHGQPYLQDTLEKRLEARVDSSNKAFWLDPGAGCCFEDCVYVSEVEIAGEVRPATRLEAEVVFRVSNILMNLPPMPPFRARIKCTYSPQTPTEPLRRLLSILRGETPPEISPEPICEIRDTKKTPGSRRFWPIGTELLTKEFPPIDVASGRCKPDLSLNLSLLVLAHQLDRINRYIRQWGPPIPWRSMFWVNLGASVIRAADDLRMLDGILESEATPFVMFEINEHADTPEHVEKVRWVLRNYARTRFGYDDTRVFGLFLTLRNIFSPGPKFVKIDHEFLWAATKDGKVSGVKINNLRRRLTLFMEDAMLGRHDIILEGVKEARDADSVAEFMRQAHCSSVFVQGWFLKPDKTGKQCRLCDLESLPVECRLPELNRSDGDPSRPCAGAPSLGVR